MSDAQQGHKSSAQKPEQMMLSGLFGFVILVLVIVGIVTYVSMGFQPGGSKDASLHGLSAMERERSLAERIAPVGAVTIREANRELATGETVFKTQCNACHGTPGIPAAPHFGDAAAWGPRIGQGYETLLQHALKGKGAMTPQGGGDYQDIEIGRAVVYMANAGGAKFPEPAVPAAPAAGADGAAAAEAAK